MPARCLSSALVSAALSATVAFAQTPTADSGAFQTRPLVPAQGETTTVTVTGEFAFSNAAVSLGDFEVTPELVTVDLTTVWTEGDAAVDATVTPWSLDLELGDLAPDVYDLWVRVDGETFLFTYFQVESARVAPGPLPDPVPTVTPRRRLGINLATLKDHSTMFTTVDVFKASRTWIPHRPSDDTWDTGLRLDLDTLGWVRSLQPDQEAGTLMMANLGSAYPGGRWEVLYDGQGELDVDWDARVIDAEPGRLVLWVTPEEGMHLVIRETDPDDYIRNIRVVTPGFEDADQLFHPTYVGFLQQFGVLRFMDWSDANEPENNVDEVGEWENRITADHASQGTIRGVSLEYMIAMANQVGADAWFSVPIVATDDFVDSMATMVRDRLDPGLTAYIELSNEVWNPSFPQHAVAAERGRALGFSDPTAANEGYRFIFADPEQFLSAVRFHAHRSVQVFEIFERVFGGRERFVRVIGGWAPDGNELAVQVAEEILDFQDAYTQADAYAIAPYFGITLALEERQEFVETSSVDAILDTATAELRFMLDVGRAVLDVTEARGLELVTYESGQHMVQATETPYLSDLVEAKLTLAQNDERLYDMYTEYLNAWAQFGGLMNLFNDSLPLGSFGLVSRWDQDLATAPRYRAVQDFLVTEDPNQPAPRTGDADGDGDIDLDDFFVFVEAFLTSDARFDFDGNDIVNLDDFFEFSEVFGT